MAERRMFAKSIVLSDSFLDMPMSARCLYFTLGMLADDDGFVGSPKSIMRQCGASQDDMLVLLQKRYVLSFESGVIVIKHWKMNNYLQSDRHKETTYIEELRTLTTDQKGAYVECIQNVYTGKDSIGKYSIDKNSIDKSSIEKGIVKGKGYNLDEELEQYPFTDILQDTIREWFKYKKEKKQDYKPIGAKSLLKQIANHVSQYGEKPVQEVIELSMANNWQGIIWDKLVSKKDGKGSSQLDDFYNMASEWANSGGAKNVCM